MNRFRANTVQIDGDSGLPIVPSLFRYPVMNYRLILAAPQSVPFFLSQSHDHREPATGLEPDVFLSSAGSPFLLARGAVTETGGGWYSVVPDAGEILGIAPLLLSVPPPNLNTDPCTARVEILPVSGVAPLRVGMARYPLTFYMTTVNHISPAMGLSPVVAISKSGGPFAAPIGTISEIGHGWYQCRPDPADVDTVGPIVLKATATGADDAFETYNVVGSVLDGEIDRYTLALLMIRTMIINSGLFTEATCVISLDSKPFPTPSLPSMWINPGSTGFDQELEAGGTRYTLLTSPIFTLNIIVRRMQDVEVHDQNWITNVKRGAYPIVWKVINLLAGKFIYSVTGDLLTTRNLRPLQIGHPYRYDKDAMVSVVPITFTTDVQIDVDLPYPYIPVHH